MVRLCLCIMPEIFGVRCANYEKRPVPCVLRDPSHGWEKNGGITVAGNEEATVLRKGQQVCPRFVFPLSHRIPSLSFFTSYNMDNRPRWNQDRKRPSFQFRPTLWPPWDDLMDSRTMHECTQPICKFLRCTEFGKRSSALRASHPWPMSSSSKTRGK